MVFVIYIFIIIVGVLGFVVSVGLGLLIGWSIFSLINFLVIVMC